jgi:hypothetical protein
MAVWICQCLCPDRHCILATADEAENEDEASRLIRTRGDADAVRSRGGKRRDEPGLGRSAQDEAELSDEGQT